MHLSGFVSFPFDSPEMHTDNTWIRSLQRAPCINVWLFSDAAIPIPQTRQNTFRIHGHWFHMRLRFICFDSLRVRHVYNIFHALHTLSHSLYISVCAVLCCNVFSSPIDTSIVCAVRGSFFFCCLCNDVGLFHIDIRIRYVWSNRKPIDQIEQSNWEAILRYQNVFINLGRREKTTTTPHTHIKVASFHFHSIHYCFIYLILFFSGSVRFASIGWLLTKFKNQSAGD